MNTVGNARFLRLISVIGAVQRHLLADGEHRTVESLFFQNPGQGEAVTAVIAGTHHDGGAAGPVVSLENTHGSPVHQPQTWHKIGDGVGIAEPHILNRNTRNYVNLRLHRG